MKALDLANVQEAGTWTGLKAGGYVCRYTNVEDIADKEYLLMEFDICEGENAGYYKQLEERFNFWGGKCIRSYKEKALPMFKRMCSAVTKSNTGFIFDGGAQNSNEKTLVGKVVGIILGEEEYEKNNGEIGTRLYVYAECEADKIRKGDFKIPKKKELEKPATANNGFVNVPATSMEEIPFN